MRKFIVFMFFLFIIPIGRASAERVEVTGHPVSYLASFIPGDLSGALFLKTDLPEKLGSIEAFKSKPDQEKERAREILESVLKEIRGDFMTYNGDEDDRWSWFRDLWKSADLIGIAVFMDLPAPLVVGHLMEKERFESSMTLLEETLENSYGEIHTESRSFDGLTIRWIYVEDKGELFWTVHEDSFFLWSEEILTDKIIGTFSGDIPPLVNNRKFSELIASIPSDADIVLFLDLPFLLSGISVRNSFKEVLGKMEIGGLLSFASVTSDGIRDYVRMKVGEELISPISDILPHVSKLNLDGISDILSPGIVSLLAISFEDLKPIWELLRPKLLSPEKLMLLQMRLGFKVSDLLKSLGPRVFVLLSRGSVGAMTRKLVKTGDISSAIRAGLSKGSALAFEIRDGDGLKEILKKLEKRSEIPSSEEERIVHIRIDLLPNPGNIVNLPTLEFYYIVSSKWFVVSRDPDPLLSILSSSDADLGKELAKSPSRLQDEELFNLIYLDGPKIAEEIWGILGNEIRSALGCDEEEWAKTTKSLPKASISFDIFDCTLQFTSFSPIGGLGTSLILLSLISGYMVIGGI